MKPLLLAIILLFTGKCIDAQTFTPKGGEDEIFSFAETPATFPGGDSLYWKFIKDSLRYPEAERARGMQGRVYVQFVVEKDGSITNLKTLKGVNAAPGLTREAMRVLSSMPKWTPGKMNGRPVRLYVTQPVKFVLPPDIRYPVRAPSYPGGTTALDSFVESQLVQKYRKYDKEISMKTVRLHFRVNPAGIADSITAIHSEGNDQAEMIAVEIIGALDRRWKPGMSGNTLAAIWMYAEMRMGERDSKYRTKALITVLNEPPAPEAGTLISPSDSCYYPSIWRTHRELFADVPPQYGADRNGASVFMQRNVKYPQVEKEMNMQGTVTVSFFIETDGSVTGTEILQEVAGAPGLTSETLRVLALMEKWEPGKKNGVAARTKIIVPVVFQLL
jgi:TonB family protein